MSEFPSDRPGSFRTFGSTAWTLIREAQALPASRRGELLERLLRRYWKPIYAYYRSLGKSSHEAEDLVQSFLCGFVENSQIMRVGKDSGRFRDWLKVCCRNHMVSEERRRRAKRRRPPQGLVSFEQLKAEDGEPFQPAAREDPDRAFRDAWRRDLLDRAFRTVAAECEEQDRREDFEVFLEYYANTEPRQPTWEAIAKRHALGHWRQAARKADWIKSQLARAIRAEIACYVDSEDDIDNEIRELFQ